MPEFDRIAEMIAMLKREIEGCRLAYEAGARIALVSALRLCRERPEITSRWVIDAALEALKRLPENERVGRPAESLVHFERWANVKHARERQAAFRLKSSEQYSKEEKLRSKQMLAPPKKRSDRSGFLSSVGNTWEHAYEAASLSLSGTLAQGSARAMKESYLLVEREIKEGRGAQFFVDTSGAFAEIEWDMK